MGNEDNSDSNQESEKVLNNLSNIKQDPEENSAKSEEKIEKKPNSSDLTKSSIQILSELFSAFDAEPPVIVKKEKDESSKKHKKSKKKHKHKDKKKHKKDRKRKRSDSSSSSSSEIDLSSILIKQEKEAAEKKIKIEGTNLELAVSVKEENVKTEKEYDKRKIKKEKLDNEEESSSSLTQKILKLKRKIQESGIGESNESSDSEKSDKSKQKKKHKHKSDKKPKIRSKSREKAPSKERSKEDLRLKLKEKSRDKEREKDKSKDDFYKGSDKDLHRSRHRSRDNSKERHRSHEYRSDRHRSHDRDREFQKELEDYKSKRRDSFHRDTRPEREEKWFMRDRYRGYDDRDRDRSRHRSPIRDSNHIDKKKLLEIARKNAIQMMKSGSLPGALTLGPQAQEKVIAAIKAGGKTIEELTDFCKTLSKKEEMDELSSLSEHDQSSDEDTAFHHPFQLKDRPTSITMNIKNAVPLPVKSTQERTTELRMQFPVSSGQHHRRTESEWVPVSPTPAPPPTVAATTKKVDPKPVPPPNTPTTVPAVTSTSTTELLAIEAPPAETPVAVVPAPANAPPGPQAFPTPMLEPTVDIGSIVSQRLTAIRRLQENPNDVQALTQMYKSNKEMQSWAQSKQQPGLFTGSTGAQIMSQTELSSGYQAWAKKDQLQSAAPVSGGMGMHLLQKMGWKPGEGLGKEKTGTLEPLLLEVKLDKKGLVANEETKKKAKPAKTIVNSIKQMQGKHPVSLLGEYASKKKLGAPEYILEFECGPDHKKNFLFKVVLNGIEYKPNIASCNKKEAKAAAATICLQQIGLLPS